MNQTVKTRLAPSPTGFLHPGNVWSFLICWLAARSAAGSVILRIEDIDTQRSRAEYVRAIVEDLRWLGLDWDTEPEMPEIILQSSRQNIYGAALEKLTQKGRTFPCFCSRKELRMLSSAPHAEDSAPAYPGTCANLAKETVDELLARNRQHCTRLKCPEEPVVFTDLLAGRQVFRKEQYGGDFPLLRADGIWAYQLATAVDDGLMGINTVIRGRDLLASTPRQLLVLRYLDLPAPNYAHIPLLLDENGERLAKRHAALSLRALRAKGIAAQKIIGLLGKYMGINPGGAACRAQDLVHDFSLTKLPKNDIKIAAADFLSL